MKQNDLNDVSYKLSSQLYENIFNVYEDSDIGYFFNLLKTVNFPKDIRPDVYDIYVVEPEDTWPIISWKAYGTVFLWWSICAMNQINNPTAPLVPGTELKILKALNLRNILLDLQTQ